MPRSAPAAASFPPPQPTNRQVNFLGICHDPPCILTEFCARGSLAEVLAAGRTDPAAAAQLTWARRLAMAANAASGMLYLHSRPAPIVHRGMLVGLAWGWWERGYEGRGGVGGIGVGWKGELLPLCSACRPGKPHPRQAIWVLSCCVCTLLLPHIQT